MCGIWAYIGNKRESELKYYFQTIAHRGPDNSKFKQITECRFESVFDRLYMGFHRLAINGLNAESDQPMQVGKNILICNGEIYNYKELQQKYKFPYRTDSDCEIILHLYRRFGIKKTCQKLDGVFAFVLYDGEKNCIYAARDPYGVRQLFMGSNDTYKDDNELGFSSEAKGLLFMESIYQVTPGSYWCNKQKDRGFQNYFYLEYSQINYPFPNGEADILPEIRRLLTQAVQKRTMSDRKIGALLSGGLDSSLITGLLAKTFKNPKDLETFSIGLKGSPDLFYAKKVADFLGTKHTSVELSEEEFLNAIDKVIYVLGSYDVTTIRASVGHWLICQYIKEHSAVKVVFSGEYADEQNLSYLYGMNAPSPTAFQEESIRLLQYIGYFDNLRADHCMSNAGLEARIPFADKAFMDMMMSLDPQLKMFSNSGKMEKYLIRKAFDGMNIIPQEVLWRRKNGFSDSVSNKERSWSTIIKEWVDKKITDKEFELMKDSKDYRGSPTTKEAYYYRQVYESYYISSQTHSSDLFYLTPFQWLPKWCGDVTDPSARTLSKLYQAD
jgi:asparagine synthase (glutamine-hydrolysing)